MIRYFCRAGDLAGLTEFDGRMIDLVKRFLQSLGPAIRPVNIELAAFIVSNALRSAVLLSIVQKPERLTDADFRHELTHLVVSYLRPTPS